MPASDDLLMRAQELSTQNVPFVLATVVRCESPASAKPGAKAIITEDGTIDGWIGGGCAQPAVISSAKKAIADGAPRLIRISPSDKHVAEEGIVEFRMTCHSGGTLDIFIDPFASEPVLLVIGASPTARALADMAGKVGFSVVSAFRGIDEPDSGDATASSNANPRFVVVATQGRKDEEGLEMALRTSASYLALIASERKANKLRSYMKERGHDDERVDAVISPAGIDIGAVTPEEIALSVLAALVKERREPSLIVPIGPNAFTEHESDQREAIDPVCNMRVDTETAEYKSEHLGATYFFCREACMTDFRKAPSKYAEAAVSGEPS